MAKELVLFIIIKAHVFDKSKINKRRSEVFIAFVDYMILIAVVCVQFDNSSEGEAENASDSLQTRRMRGSSTIRGSAEPDLGIFISSPVKNLILQAESTNERDLWLFDLNAQINEVKQDRVRRSTVQLNYSPIVEH